MKRVFWLLAPPVIITLTYGLLVWMPEWFDFPAVLTHLPLILAAVLALYAAIFNRLRLGLPAIIAATTYWFLQHHLQAGLTHPETLGVYHLLHAWVCLLLIIGALVRERGFMTLLSGVILFCIVSGFGGLIYLSQQSFWLETFRQWQHTQQSLLADFPWITPVLIMLHGAVALVLLLALAIRRTTAEYAVLLVWMTTALVLFDYARPTISAALFTALFIALLVLYLQSHYRKAFVDSLTGIPGRRSLDEYLASLGRRYAIAMADVDHFKKFNDTHGHDVGDQVLKMVAGRIAKVGRQGKAFRYGGEEFAIVFPFEDTTVIASELDQLRRSIEQYPLTIRSATRSKRASKTDKKRRGRAPGKGKTTSVTVSIGVAVRIAGDKTPHTVIKRADQALYKAKRGGRNKVVIG